MANTYPMSKIIMYKTKIKYGERQVIESLTDYLGLCASSSTYDFQRIKHRLDLTIKIDYTQDDAEQFPYNYIQITNYADASSPDKTFYYYILNAEPVSSHTLKLTLRMDTLNTSYTLPDSDSVPNPYRPNRFNENTMIDRQHSDRFYKPTGYTKGTGGLVARKVDAVSEGVAPLQIKKADNTINSTSYPNLDWYLIYKSGGTNQPIKTMLCASEPLLYKKRDTYQGTVNPSDLTADKYYYFSSADNGFIDVRLPSFQAHGEATVMKDLYVGNGDEHPSAVFNEFEIYDYYVSSPTPSTVYYCVGKYKFKAMEWYQYQTNSIVVRLFGDKISTTNYSIDDLPTYDGVRWQHDTSRSVSDPINMPQSVAVTLTLSGIYIKSSLTGRVSDTQLTTSNIDSMLSVTDTHTFGTNPNYYICGIDDIDRSDSTISKILRLPYCPITYTVSDDGEFTPETNWALYDGNNTPLAYSGRNLPSLYSEDCCTFNFVNPMVYNIPATVSEVDSKQLNAESKLWHSDISTCKVLYDSFSKQIKPELFDEPTDRRTGFNNYISIDFKPTSTMNSKFAFKINMNDYSTYNDDEDYGTYLLVTRNNEDTLYNNEYVNYIKTGYNYDKKANALSMENSTRSAVFGTISSVIGTAAGVVTGLASANPVAVGTSITGGISSIASSWSNVQALDEQQKNTMASKIANLQAQAASASGSDDIDLMAFYCGNRLHYLRYEPTDIMKKALYDVFDVSGYAVGRQGVPVVDSRIWHNYIQCTPVINKPSNDTVKLNDEIEQDITSQYQQGVTIFHEQIPVATPTWDIKNQYENWETWI